MQSIDILYARKRDRRTVRLPAGAGDVLLFGMSICGPGDGGGVVAIDPDDAVFAIGRGLLCAFVQALLRLVVGQ